VREAAARMQCSNNLKQLILAVHNCHDVHHTLPTYFGVFPSGTNIYPWGANQTKMYGSWFVHLLPFVEQNNLWNFINADIQSSGWNQDHYATVSGGSYGQTVVQQYVGHTYVYQPFVGQTLGGYQADGIWINGAHDATFPLLQCPSDPTAVESGMVYNWWGATSYVANFNAFAAPNPNGVWAFPPRFDQITDGLSNTVFFGEAYANCDTIGRIALYSWYYHNFGIDWYQQPNTFMFQDQPLPKDCDNWRAQSNHVGGMNVALGDGSVRNVHPSVSQQTWTNALLPRDGQPLGSDW
jgi:hypothetical protein